MPEPKKQPDSKQVNKGCWIVVAWFIMLLFVCQVIPSDAFAILAFFLLSVGLFI